MFKELGLKGQIFCTHLCIQGRCGVGSVLRRDSRKKGRGAREVKAQNVIKQQSVEGWGTIRIWKLYTGCSFRKAGTVGLGQIFSGGGGQKARLADEYNGNSTYDGPVNVTSISDNNVYTNPEFG